MQKIDDIEKAIETLCVLIQSECKHGVIAERLPELVQATAELVRSINK